MKQVKNPVNHIPSMASCYGCGVCAASCPKHIIDIRLDKKGFYSPLIIDPDACVQCGICVDVCAFYHKELALQKTEVQAWAGWSNDEEVRSRCSSGGIAFEISRQFLQRGYHIVACRYNPTLQRAEHYIATTEAELIPSAGSKYIQSYTPETFRRLRRGEQRYVVIGTPCQIDSVRRMICRFHCEERFLLVDFFCYHVPSMYTWQAYLRTIEKQTGEVTHASWRNKWTLDKAGIRQPVNWHDSYNIHIQGTKGELVSRFSQGNHFYKMFLGNYCIGPHCQKDCKYKYLNSSADIRLGDLWGKSYAKDDKGVSILLTFTPKGLDAIHSLQGITLCEHSVELVTEGQTRHRPSQKMISPLLTTLFRFGLTYNSVPIRATLFTQKVIDSLKARLKRIL